MLAFISKLQRKPEHVRKKIAIVSSAAVTALITLLWLISLDSAASEPVSSAKLTEKEIGMFQALTDGLSGLFSDASTALQATVGAFAEPEKENTTAIEEGAAEPFPSP